MCYCFVAVQTGPIISLFTVMIEEMESIIREIRITNSIQAELSQNKKYCTVKFRNYNRPRSALKVSI